jgi:long-chain acyl-CoA synthetase
MTTSSSTTTPRRGGTDIAVVHPIGETGETVLDLFDQAVHTRGAHAAMRRRDAHGHWQAIAWSEYAAAVREIAAGLHGLGVRPGDRAGILAFNRPEWHEADMGVLAAAVVSVPIYQTSAGAQVAYVLSHSGARVCFVDGEEQFAKIVEHRDELPELRHVVMFEATTPSADGFLLSLDALRVLGREVLARESSVVDERRRDVVPGDLATLVYTSGTTGPPKGAMLTHANLMATMRSITQLITFDEQDRFLSFLPLSHITERCVSHFGLVLSRGETWFARSITTVPDDLPDCRPTVFFAVPRVWEKFKDALTGHVDDLPGWPGRLARRYLELAPARARELETANYMPFHAKAEWLALDKFVGTKLRTRIGLDRARVLSSGAAPIHPDLLRFFHGIGLPIAEGYGQTEVSLATSLNPPGRIRIGTVGPPIPGVEVRIAGDGEILVKGANVCAGYWRNPTASAELIDADGWLHTGDVGTVDDDGYLRITDRKKDIIVTAHGKNIAPQVLETELKLHPLIAHAVVIGEGRRYLTALVSLDVEEAARWADDNGRAFSIEALAADPDLRAEIDDAVTGVNRNHARAENIRKWRVLPGELTITGGELTPTLKLRRKIVNEKYASEIEEMYAS